MFCILGNQQNSGNGISTSNRQSIVNKGNNNNPSILNSRKRVVNGNQPYTHQEYPRQKEKLIQDIDTDRDGVPDKCDKCVGFNDKIDNDGDGIADGCDNCPSIYNSDQFDDDKDGVGNSCDVCPFGNDKLDTDHDGIPNDCDYCPNFKNPKPATDNIDSDTDGFGDLCDNCPYNRNDQQDADHDGVGNVCDICDKSQLNIASPDYKDTDKDGTPDACDRCEGFDDRKDTDKDGVPDDCDNCIDHFNPDQKDSESEGGDGVGDVCDNCVSVYNPRIWYPGNLLKQPDLDLDGVGDACDNCVFKANSDQEASEDAGIGKQCSCQHVFHNSFNKFIDFARDQFAHQSNGKRQEPEIDDQSDFLGPPCQIFSSQNYFESIPPIPDISGVNALSLSSPSIILHKCQGKQHYATAPQTLFLTFFSFFFLFYVK